MYQALIKSLTSTQAPVPQLTMHATAALFANQSILKVDPPFQIARARSVNGTELHTGYCIGERSIDAVGRSSMNRLAHGAERHVVVIQDSIPLAPVCCALTTIHKGQTWRALSKRYG